MFSEQERKIFKYNDGQKDRYADPLAIRRALIRESGGQFWTWWDDCEEPKAASFSSELTAEQLEHARALHASLYISAAAAQERFLSVVRAVFKMPELNPDTGEGVVEDECWRVIREYDEFLEKNERAAGNSPTTLSAATLPGADGNSTTPPTSP